MLRIVFLLLLFVLSPLSVASPENQLRDNASPYLALHADDPVNWQVWDQSVLDRARQENKLIFVSSGYFACHWCHVMRRESYQNKAIAALLNEHFIPVKIDRELEPALDAHLIEFVRSTRGSAGWPLNVFLTPDGYPLVGLTYAPAESFKGLLERLQKVWGEQSQALSATAKSAALELYASAEPPAESPTIDYPQLGDDLITMVLAFGDDLGGGIGQQNRFPMSSLWNVLLTFEKARSDSRVQALVTLTLDQMAAKGLRDHLAGGFFRYTVDPGWRVPHFEKMLYTQALQSELFLNAGKRLGREDYLAVARDTLDFTLSVFAGNSGGYIASLSAVDPQDNEGGGYLWTDQQLTALLTEDELAFTRKRWNLHGDAVIDDGYLPTAGQSIEELVITLQQPLAKLRELETSARQKLLADSAKRAHPRDTKQLAAWNGLLLSTLTHAAQAFDSSRYKQAAQALKEYLVTELWNGKKLLRAKDAGGEIGQATLEDYAFVADGLYRWGLFAQDQSAIELASIIVQQAWQRFYQPSGWVSTDQSLIPGIGSDFALSDNPLPSPIPVLIRLTAEMGDQDRKAQAKNALQMGYGEFKERPLWYATHVLALLEANDD